MGETVSLFREPDAGKPPVRFDEREQETAKSSRTEAAKRKPSQIATGRLQPLRLFSTLQCAPTAQITSGGRTRPDRCWLGLVANEH